MWFRKRTKYVTHCVNEEHTRLFVRNIFCFCDCYWYDDRLAYLIRVARIYSIEAGGTLVFRLIPFLPHLALTIYSCVIQFLLLYHCISYGMPQNAIGELIGIYICIYYMECEMFFMPVWWQMEIGNWFKTHTHAHAHTHSVTHIFFPLSYAESDTQEGTHTMYFYLPKTEHK